MVRTEAYAVMDGLMLVVHGTCTGERHAGKRCRRQIAITTVPTSEIEDWGVWGAMVRALEALFFEHPQMADMVLC